ncbi:HugZ family pyridoxamine 5'-phosphate oxidase [Gallionella capsiferriformans]|uniref:Pyridoxamine 5'-phosphate oxidase-related FMN-binding n=1 Tax=Gallionella capsiferriformans (strain ES-2) TaxID=395494 RepID=D9SCB0_GALCS|nr:pyridoxamine 5'-phosphate oxidase family protein [Gallionella capsiferriformans]ADL54575.1 pyridoxamine 5'-phosphate oxidase-related FMN-binding [Gallionella capsiferriformans ES-2]
MSHAQEARRLLRAHRYGALSTLSKKLAGFPFGSITPYLTDHDGSLIILISALAEHTKNIKQDPRVSLITHNQSSPDIQMQGRVTATGLAEPIRDHQSIVHRYLRHFPEADDLLKLDFAFYRIIPVAIRHIAGVGQIHWINKEDYAAHAAEDFSAHEATLLRHINNEQQDALCQQLQRSHDVRSSSASAYGLDCDGLDVRTASHSFRLDFSQPLTHPKQFTSLTELTFRSP